MRPPATDLLRVQGLLYQQLPRSAQLYNLLAIHLAGDGVDRGVLVNEPSRSLSGEGYFGLKVLKVPTRAFTIKESIKR